ncbi:MAG: NUDIX hydrolase [Scytolyngbya sp. HA4215-MV1]|jgi:8-oxo-dGTP pyrophosphatase MutT (NUDIX family)|nr:NUDIX hydrolase [Scytolyngbya sp. HA4215-MV1]
MSHQSAPITDDRVAVAIAILYRQGQLLLQLRDNIPGILYPGYWGLFGGHLEPGESPEVAMERELLEEIHYSPPHLTLFNSYRDDPIIRHVFYAPLTVEMDALQLSEGWDMGLFSLEDIRRGDRYSERANQVRPLGKPHQKILLEFFETHASLATSL